MRNKTLTQIIIATLLCALLVNAGRATRAFALALPSEPIQPVYETEVIALYDYVSNNLEQNVPQLDIFFLLTGALAVAQLGAQDALLESPYPNESSVKEWLINCGIQLYNSVIGLVPSGDYYTNIPLVGQPDSAVKGIPRSMIKALVAQMMGNAVVARNYSSVDDFLNDDTQHLMPFQRDLQVSINAIWQLQGGPYHWQFDTAPFTSNGFSWHVTDVPALSNYWTLIANASEHVLVSTNQTTATDRFNMKSYASFFDTYHNLFINTQTGRYYLLSDSGQSSGSITYGEYLSTPINFIYYESGSGMTRSGNLSYYSSKTYTVYDTYLEIAQHIFDTDFLSSTFNVNIADFVQHVYVGTNWIDKQELFNVSDLNISDNINDYYESPEQDNLLIDIKNLISDLVDTTDIWNTIINNVYDPDGTQIVNPPTIKVSVDLTPITELLAPPIPVDLNDIAIYTDNDYLEEVKERSRKFGETIGEYFVFWHNSDPITVYVIFGSFIVILVGAFIGKWGHS